MCRIFNLKFRSKVFWVIFWLLGIIYTCFAIYQDTTHYLQDGELREHFAYYFENNPISGRNRNHPSPKRVVGRCLDVFDGIARIKLGYL